MFSYIVFSCLDIPVKHSLSLFIYYIFHFNDLKSNTLDCLFSLLSLSYVPLFCSLAKGPFTKYVMLFLPIFTPPPLPVLTPWPLVIACDSYNSSTTHHKICDSGANPPPPKKKYSQNTYLIYSKRYLLYVKSTLFQCLIIKPRSKQFPTKFLAGSLNNNIL